MVNDKTNNSTLMTFCKDGVEGRFDIIDGKFDYQGDLPISDAAKMLFETLAVNCGEWWIERASVKETRDEL